jgi:purine-cytosine permease-like protein
MSRIIHIVHTDDLINLTQLGIVIIAIISWVVATFGIQVFHYYERSAISFPFMSMLAADH